VLSIFLFLSVVFNIFVFSLAVKQAKLRNEFELFYLDTIDDVSSVIQMLDKLLERQFLSDDSDVQNLYRIIAITHDILIGYVNAGISPRESKRTKK